MIPRGSNVFCSAYPCRFPVRPVKAPSAPIDVGISEHTDFEVFTIMHQESAGLHLCAPSGGSPPRWYQLPFRHDTLTVILGVRASPFRKMAICGLTMTVLVPIALAQCGL